MAGEKMREKKKDWNKKEGKWREEMEVTEELRIVRLL